MAEVTLLMTDVVDSTVVAQRLGDTQHIEKFVGPLLDYLEHEVQQHNGIPYQKQVEPGDDSFKAYFASAVDAVTCAAKIQMHLQTQGVPAGEQRAEIHMALHTAPAMPGGLPGPIQVSYCARILSLSDAGQMLVSCETYPLVKSIVRSDFKEHKKRYLKGFSELESVFEYLYDGKVRREPGTRFIPLDYVESANVYIEREAVEKQVRETFLAKRGQVPTLYRLVTIHGYGGMGKTRLAVTCAKQMAGAFKGGVYFVSLASLIEASRCQMASEMCRVLRLPLEPTDDPAEKLLALLHQSREILFVLDNAETITASSEVLRFIKELLGASSEVRLLVTSREKLNLPGEIAVDINEGLTPDEAANLFLERAKEGDANKPLPASDNPDLQELLTLACYSPLAIQFLAARWQDKGTIAEMRDRYKQALFRSNLSKSRGLPEGDAAAEKRHASLLASLDWSWNRLGAGQYGTDAQSVFLAASLFDDPFCDEALLATLGWKDQERLERAISRLTDTALVMVLSNTTPTRYRMHRFSQFYGREEWYKQVQNWFKRLLEIWRSPILRLRFITYYLQLMQMHNSRLTMTEESENSRRVFENEWRNVRVAATLCLTMKAFVTSITLHALLTTYFELCGRWADWEIIVREANEIARKHLKSTIQVGYTLMLLGNVYDSQGRWNEAIACYEQALDIYRSLGDRHGEGKTLKGQTLNNLGVVYGNQGRWIEAIACYEQALGIKRSLGDRQGEGQTLGNLGIVYDSQGRFDKAIECYKKDLDICRSLGDKHGEGKTLMNLGNFFQKQDCFDEAIACYEQSLPIFHSLGDKHGEGLMLMNLGIVYDSQGRFDEAIECYEKSLDIVRSLDDRHGEAMTLDNLALLWMEQNRYDLAKPYAEQAIAAAEQTQDVARLEKYRQHLAVCEQRLQEQTIARTV